MTKLLSIRFDTGRPKFSPEEEGEIRLRTTTQAFRDAVHVPAATLVVIGYIDRDAESGESRRIAFRRAQLVIDLLRDRCGVHAAFQAATLVVATLPAHEQADKQRLVEVWIVNP